MVPPIILRFGNWLLQGCFSVSKEELLIKIITEVGIVTALKKAFSLDPSSTFSRFGLYAFVHTLSWFTMTNIWSVRSKPQGEQGRLPSEHFRFLDEFLHPVLNKDCIDSAAIFGSLSTGEYHSNSDIDVKILRKPGALNTLYSYMVLFYIRTISNKRKIPLDIYIISSPGSYNPKPNEIPIILVDKDGQFQSEFLHYQNYNAFKKMASD